MGLTQWRRPAYQDEECEAVTIRGRDKPVKLKCYRDREGHLWVEVATKRCMCIRPEIDTDPYPLTLEEVSHYHGPLREVVLSDEHTAAAPTSETERLEEELERVKYDRDCLRGLLDKLAEAMYGAALGAREMVDDWMIEGQERTR
jgi:hypothetical protein